MGIAINDGGDRRQVLAPMALPFPPVVRQSHWFGGKYPALARRRQDALAVGSLYDWSENGRHLAGLGQATMKNWGFDTSTSSSAPTTAESLNDIASSGAITIVAVARTFANAKPVNLARTANGAPIEIQMSLFGASPRLEARQGAGVPAVVTFSAAAMATGFCMFVAAWSAGKRGAWFKSPTGALVGQEEISDAPFGSPDPLEFGIDASGGEGDGVTTLVAIAIADLYPTFALLTEFQASYKTFVTRLGSPFTA